MSSKINPGKLKAGELAREMRGQMIPLNNRFSYFFTALPLTEDDIREYLEEPVAALPPALCERMPKASILLVPYLERSANGELNTPFGEPMVSFEKPAENVQIWSAKLISPEEVILVFSLKGQDVAEYHHRFFHGVAEVAAEFCGEDPLDAFSSVLHDELSGGAHGEVDEDSWNLKQALLRRQRHMRRRTKGFARYAHQAFTDTLTLYLHGICCDIDVEPGPRQIASRHLRRRLRLLQSLYPPPEGYAVFPDEVNHIEDGQLTS